MVSSAASFNDPGRFKRPLSAGSVDRNANKEITKKRLRSAEPYKATQYSSKQQSSLQSDGKIMPGNSERNTTDSPKTVTGISSFPEVKSHEIENKAISVPIISAVKEKEPVLLQAVKLFKEVVERLFEVTLQAHEEGSESSEISGASKELFGLFNQGIIENDNAHLFKDFEVQESRDINKLQNSLNIFLSSKNYEAANTIQLLFLVLEKQGNSQDDQTEVLRQVQDVLGENLPVEERSKKVYNMLVDRLPKRHV